MNDPFKSASEAVIECMNLCESTDVKEYAFAVDRIAETLRKELYHLTLSAATNAGRIDDDRPFDQLPAVEAYHRGRESRSAEVNELKNKLGHLTSEPSDEARELLKKAALKLYFPLGDPEGHRSFSRDIDAFLLYRTPSTGWVICPKCGGSKEEGGTYGPYVCTKCNGEGKIPKPPGMKEGA